MLRTFHIVFPVVVLASLTALGLSVIHQGGVMRIDQESIYIEAPGRREVIK